MSFGPGEKVNKFKSSDRLRRCFAEPFQQMLQLVFWLPAFERNATGEIKNRMWLTFYGGGHDRGAIEERPNKK